MLPAFIIKLISSFKILLIAISIVLITGCNEESTLQNEKTVPHEGRWGIYALDLSTQIVTLIYSSSNEIYTSALRLNNTGDTLVFAQEINGTGETFFEICTIGVDGENFRQVTDNNYWDLYPSWSSDGTEIIFLSWRENDLDIYVMNADGCNVHKLYDSGFHDADIDWAGDNIVFTSQSRIWKMQDDGTDSTMLTDPPRAGEWGNANLPFGDYDPRLNSDGSKIVFERLEGDSSIHGNYNIYTMNINGSEETRRTNNGYSQGLASWSLSGDKIVYTVSSINDEGKYDLYIMNANGTNNQNITPSYFPIAFLCYTAIFSNDDSKIYFMGEWWE